MNNNKITSHKKKTKLSIFVFFLVLIFSTLSQTLTFAYSLDGTNFTNFASTAQTPIENWTYNFHLDLSNIPNGNVTIYTKINDWVKDSNVESITLNKNITIPPVTITWDLTVNTGEQYPLQNNWAKNQKSVLI